MIDKRILLFDIETTTIVEYVQDLPELNKANDIYQNNINT